MFAKHGLVDLLKQDFDFRITEPHHCTLELIGSELGLLSNLRACDLVLVIE